MDGPDQPPPPPGMPPPPPPPPPVSQPPARPALDISGAVQFGWDAFRAQPGPLVGAVVITYTVLFLLLGVVGLSFALIVRVGGAGGAAEALVAVAGIGLGLLGFTAFTVAAQLPTVVLLRAAVDVAAGRPVTLGGMFRGAGLGRLVGAMFLVILGVLVGYVFLIIPGIVFGVLSAFTLHHMIEDETLSAVDGIRASIETIRQRPWPSLGIIIVTGLIAGLGTYACFVGIVVSAPVGILAQYHGFRQITERPLGSVASS